MIIKVIPTRVQAYPIAQRCKAANSSRREPLAGLAALRYRLCVNANWYKFVLDPLSESDRLRYLQTLPREAGYFAHLHSFAEQMGWDIQRTYDVSLALRDKGLVEWNEKLKHIKLTPDGRLWLREQGA